VVIRSNARSPHLAPWVCLMSRLPPSTHTMYHPIKRPAYLFGTPATVWPGLRLTASLAVSNTPQPGHLHTTQT